MADVPYRTGSKAAGDLLYASPRCFLERESQNAGPQFCLIEQLRRWGAGLDLKAAIGRLTPRRQVEILVNLGGRAFDADVGGCRTAVERNMCHVEDLHGPRKNRERSR